MPKTRPMAIVTAPGVIEFQDRPLPVLRPDEVQIKVKAVSICGGDLHIFKGGHPAAKRIIVAICVGPGPAAGLIWNEHDIAGEGLVDIIIDTVRCGQND